MRIWEAPSPPTLPVEPKLATGATLGRLVHRVAGRYDPATVPSGMNRRAFVTGLGAVLAAPLAADGQQPKCQRAESSHRSQPAPLPPREGDAARDV